MAAARGRFFSHPGGRRNDGERLHQAGYIYRDTRPDILGSAFKIKPICNRLNENHGQTFIKYVFLQNKYIVKQIYDKNKQKYFYFYRHVVPVVSNTFVFKSPNRKLLEYPLALRAPEEQSVKLSVTIGLLCCGNSCLWLQDFSLTYFLGQTQLNAVSGSGLRLKTLAYLWSKCVKWQATVSAPAVL